MPMEALAHPLQATVAAAQVARVLQVRPERQVQPEPQRLAQVLPVARPPAARLALVLQQAVVPVAPVRRPPAVQGVQALLLLAVRVARVLLVPREPARVAMARKVLQVVPVAIAVLRRTTVVPVVPVDLRVMVLSPMAVPPMAVPQPETAALVVQVVVATLAEPADLAEP